jgi:hypothetical protein
VTEQIIVSLVAFLGTALGTLGGIVASSKLTNYRIEQLEKKVEKHNSFGERIPLVEQKVQVLEKRVKHLEEYHTEKV